MPAYMEPAADPARVLTIILGGGQGARLFPLTRERAKPAVPLAGKYRLVDIPISNSINSGMRRIYLLTQFLSASLHRHVSASFKFDQFSPGFVEILAAEQRPAGTSWYEGTADAVRKNLVHFRSADFDHALILSGDQLYRMDFRTILSQHIAAQADLTVSAVPVGRDAARSLGIMRIDAGRRIVRFVEKPQAADLLDTLRLDRGCYGALGVQGAHELFLASMGIYLFNREILFDLLDNDFADFGKDIIPRALQTRRVLSHVFRGYWEDIGTIRSFYEANLDLTAELPRFNFFDMAAPIFTRPRFLPASKINGASIDHAIISDGCILSHCHVSHSIIGIRSLVDIGSHITRSIIMGADYYESQRRDTGGPAGTRPRIGIGKNTRVDHSIIDKNARIGDHCVISPHGKPDTADHPLYCIRDGIVIVPKDTLIPHGTVI